MPAHGADPAILDKIAKLIVLLFSFELCTCYLLPGSPPQAYISCYFLLNYARKRLWSTRSLCGDLNLLFSFELCALCGEKTLCKITLTLAIFFWIMHVRIRRPTGWLEYKELAIFFWIMLPGERVDSNSHTTPLAIFFWIMHTTYRWKICIENRTSCYFLLNYAVGFAYDEEAEQPTPVLFSDLLFSFELCRQTPSRIVFL